MKIKKENIESEEEIGKNENKAQPLPFFNDIVYDKEIEYFNTKDGENEFIGNLTIQENIHNVFIN